jgi:filamentous hemagglutinin
LTGGLISAAGNITAPNFIGNVVGNITGNLVVPGSNTQVLFNDSGLANASTAMTFNKTSNVFTISGNIVGGNISTAGNVTVNEVSATGTVTGGNIVTGGVISATGTVTGGNVVTGGVISATGNITGGNLLIPNSGKIIGDFSNSIAAGRTIFQTSVANSSTVLTAIPNGTGNIAGLVAYNSSDAVNHVVGAVIANATAISLRSSNIGNAAPLPILIETGNSVCATFDINGNVGIGNATPVDKLSVGGNAYVSGTVTGGNVVTGGVISATGNVNAGNLRTAGLISATGNVTGGNVVTGGVISATGNIITSGYFVGNFAGNITGNIVVPGSNTQVLFNTNGNADAVAGFTYSTDSNTMTVLGVVSSQGNVSAGNVVTGGVVSATGNVTGGNIVTSGLITGNVTGGVVSATGTVTGGNLLILNGGKITGDFSSTVASGRTIFQTSAANGISIITAVPAGTGTASGLVAYTSSDLINFGFGAIVANTTGVTLRAGNTGSAASPPLLIETGGAIRATIDVNGNVGIANAAPVDTLSVGGNAYVSGKVTTLPIALANLTAVSGARAFITDANLVASGNFGMLVGSGGANVVPVWSDGSNWYIG